MTGTVRTCSLTAAAVFLCAAAHAEGRHREVNVSYTLRASLQQTATGYTIQGSGRVTIENETPRALDEVPWHLYMNAFREDNATTHGAFLDGRAAVVTGPRTQGSIEVERLVDVRSNRPLKFGDPARDTDPTTATVRLDTPVGPGQSVSLDVEWSTSLPRLSQRTGYEGDFVFAGQWFPKVAKLEPTGEWAQFPYHPQAEFYANFGNYDVTLEVPKTHTVGASGLLIPTAADVGSSSADTGVSRYQAQAVHDFAWVAWPHFRERSESIEGVDVRLLFPAGHDHNAALTLRTLRLALPWMNRWLGPYPLPRLTVVHPPDEASGAGGMEYPGLITTGGTLLDGYFTDDVERVVIHELAHQWFYGNVATNEYRSPFLDEGLTTYVENRAMVELFDAPFDRLLRYFTELDQRAYSNAYGRDVAVSSSGAEFPSYSHLAALAYDRAALLLESCSRVYGDAFTRAIGAYAQTYRQAHPTLSELTEIVRAHVGDGAAEALRVGLTERGQVNFVAFDLQTRRAPDGVGYVNRVLVSRHGQLVLPVTIDIFDRGKPPRREMWDGVGATKVLEFETDAPAEAVCIDRDRRILLEDSRADNCATSAAPSAPRYWGGVLAWLQTILTMLAW